MATNFINNLSNTYKKSPSLQNQFATEQDYLDLFDNNQVAPQMATAYTPSVEKEGIESIINTATPIINQGGDGDGPNPTGPTTGFSSQGAPYGNAKGGMHDYSGTTTGIAGTGITGKGLMAALSFAFNPIGFFIGRYAKKTYKEYKEKKEAEEKAARDKNKAEIASIQARIDKEYKDSGGGNFGPDPTGSKERGFNMHGDGKAAMGGLMGYGGKSGTPRYKRSYFKGGLVSLRGK